MTTDATNTPIPGETQETLTALRAEYPDVNLRLQYNRGWQLHASGPCGSAAMQLSEPIRTATLRFACIMATANNMGGDAA